jgi:Ca2+-binding RTX toxin-like protein
MSAPIARCIAVISVLVAGLGLSAGSAAAGPSESLCFGQAATIVGTPDDETINGTAGPDVIAGLGGNDIIYGLGGDDRLCADDDTGGTGSPGVMPNDMLFGGSGDDQMRGAADPNGHWGGLASGGAGDDTFESIRTTYADAPRGVKVDLETGTATGWGHDTLHFVASLTGSNHSDELVGNDIGLTEGACGCDEIDGLRGDDVIKGQVGWDKLIGGGGDDLLVGGRGSDTVYPGAGIDRVRAGAGRADTISYFTARKAVTIDLAAGTATGMGHDTVAGAERATGTRFADTLYGDSGSNVLAGAAGRDSLYGRGGHDQLFGGEGRDRLYGGSGSDEAVGGPASDICNAETRSSCDPPDAS